MRVRLETGDVAWAGPHRAGMESILSMTFPPRTTLTRRPLSTGFWSRRARLHHHPSSAPRRLRA
ncbi:MAG: hypothetical protein ACRDV9_06905, partial [Acidimicrobiia bacterium]